MSTIKQCKCDPRSWGAKVGEICEHYEPILLSLDRLISICDTCHHNEACHYDKQTEQYKTQ